MFWSKQRESYKTRNARGSAFARGGEHDRDSVQFFFRFSFHEIFSSKHARHGPARCVAIESSVLRYLFETKVPRNGSRRQQRRVDVALPFFLYFSCRGSRSLSLNVNALKKKKNPRSRMLRSTKKRRASSSTRLNALS